jgi:arabinan endo-1,5-alpha-L-arabinosidase
VEPFTDMLVAPGIARFGALQGEWMKIMSGLGVIGLAAGLAATHLIAQVATQRVLQVALGADQANAQAITQVVPATRAAGQPDPAQTPAAGAAATAARVPGQVAGQGRPPMAAVGVPVLGMPFVHDPSTVVRFKGKYYVYSTGRGAPFYSSPDGETWTREGSVFTTIPDAVHATVPKNDGSGVWAPDIVRVGGIFYLYYAVSSWGSFQSAVGLMTNPVLDPKDPAYKWTDRGLVVSSNGNEDLNAIDPGVILAPDGTLWICYGSYHGSIRVTQLDPKTGLALRPKELGAPVASARESEAADIIFHDGYYYLFVNHGSCCKGKNSEYNIRVGRSKAMTGPYLDKHGDAMAQGGGSLFLAAHDHRIGPGHFGRVLDYDASPDGSEGGPERFSVHYEADLTRGGRSVLDIRPLLWSVDGWPRAGDNLSEGTYQIVSRQSENTLEAHIPTAPPAPRPTGTAAATGPVQDVPGVPIGPAVLHLSRYLTLDNQKWTIAPAGGGFSKIANSGTGDAIGSAARGGVGLAAYTGADGQMWRLEQFPDGGYRIRNKATGLSLTAAGSGALTASEFVRDDMHLWTVTTP